eukprot:178700-Chlamydomonas_euryale.AAC.1
MARRRNSRNNPRTVGVTQMRGMSGAPAAAKARSVLRPERQRSSARGRYWLGGGQVRLRGPYATLILPRSSQAVPVGKTGNKVDKKSPRQRSRSE